MQSVIQNIDDWSFHTMVVTRNKLLIKSDRWLQLYNRYLPLKLKLKTTLNPGQWTTERQEISRLLTEVGQHFLNVYYKVRDTLNHCEKCYPSLPHVRRQDRSRICRNFVSFYHSLDGCLDRLETDVDQLELIQIVA